MKIYTIVAGVNGCGKSSLTGVLRTEIDNLSRIIDADKLTAAYQKDFFDKLKRGCCSTPS